MSEYKIRYQKKTIHMFEECIKLGYVGVLNLPHKEPGGYHIERKGIIKWLAEKGIIIPKTGIRVQDAAILKAIELLKHKQDGI